MDEPAIWIALAASLAGCYFSACNIALKSFSRTRLTELLEQAGRHEQVEAFFTQLHALVLMTALVRTCLSLLTLLAALHFFQTHFTGWTLLSQYALAFVVTGVLVCLFVVAVPVSWARYQRERLLAWSIRPLRWMLKLFFPLTSFLHLIDPVIRRLSGVDLAERSESDLSDEVLSVVEEHEHAAAVDEAQKEMLEAVFDFPNTSAGEIMTPRTDVVGLEITAGLEQIKQAILNEGHSRIPVYRENLDHIAGILYAKDLIQHLGSQPSDAPFDLARMLRPPFMVPESKSVRELLAEFKAKKIHLAIVLDEYGGTAGLVTIEDIIEELVGEIQDEYEPTEEEPTIRQIEANLYEVDARLDVDELQDELNLQVPEDRDYETVGGFVFATLGHIPEVGESFDWEQFRITVTAAERTRVSRVRVERLEADTVAGNGSNGK